MRLPLGGAASTAGISRARDSLRRFGIRPEPFEKAPASEGVDLAIALFVEAKLRHPALRDLDRMPPEASTRP
jgi:hypothetical protein